MRSFIALALCFVAWAAFADNQYGLASVYSPKFQGSRTASGEVFSHNSFTAAHRTLPFGSIVKITRTDNGKWVIVKINDRGPFVNDRLTDLSRAAARKLGMNRETDEIRVKIEVLTDKTYQVGNASSAVREIDPLSIERGVERKIAVPMPESVETVMVRRAEEPRNVPKEYKVNAVKKATVTSKGVSEPTVSTNSANAKKNAVPSAKQYGLYRANMAKQEKTGYAIQVARLSNQTNMKRFVESLQKNYYQNILIKIEQGADGNPDYRVFIGPFGTQNTAESYQKSLKKKKISGFVVNLNRA